MSANVAANPQTTRRSSSLPQESDDITWELTMKSLLVSTLALGVISSPAFAADPLPLTDAQMDAVRAGQPNQGLVVVDIEDNNVAVPVNAGVAVNVLGGPTGVVATQPGRIRQ
jgi:hypothetical protein